MAKKKKNDDLDIFPFPTLNINAEFASQITDLVHSKSIGYMEAVLLWCSDRGFDEEVVGELVKKCPAIKDKIRSEAEDLHFMKEKTNRIRLGD